MPNDPNNIHRGCTASLHNPLSARDDAIWHKCGRIICAITTAGVDFQNIFAGYAIILTRYIFN